MSSTFLHPRRVQIALVGIALLLTLAYPVIGLIIGGDVQRGFTHGWTGYGLFVLLTLGGAYLALRAPRWIGAIANGTLAVVSFLVIFFAPFVAVSPLLLAAASVLPERGSSKRMRSVQA